MKYNPLKPYNTLPDLPPKADIETKTILKKIITASRALSELKGAIKNLPNPMLFIDTVNLQEAQASSAIENIITTQDELFQASITDKKVENPATKEVIHYKDALWYGLKQIKKKPILTTNLFIAIMQIVKENASGIRNIPGTQLKNPRTDKVVYTPPEGEKIIRDKLKALETFINTDDDTDPLVKLALIHYQFEAIHPFFDGNGRTGRIILLLYLQLSGLMDTPALYLSSYILENKEEYYIRLRNVTEKKDWEGWILYMLDMIEVISKAGKERISKIENLMQLMGKEIHIQLPKIYSRDLVEGLFHLPYTKRNNFAKEGIGNIKTAGNYLLKLEEKGFLRSTVVGKEKLYLNFRLMDILKKEKLGLTKKDRIDTVYGGGGHIVILGAGASVAATLRDPLPNGKKLPLMNNLVEILELTDIISKLPNHIKSENFEKLYSNLYLDNPKSPEIKEIEKRVSEYFKSLKLPDVPTIYDYLVLSLRPRDLIVTFNWDPFLYQAWSRNGHIGDRPYIAFLHGNVAIGYSKIDKRSGPSGMYSKATKNLMHPTKLLFPVTQKNYDEDEFIESQWTMFKDFLSDKNVKLVTVFGYGAPDTDALAIKTMLDAWGGGKVRNMEQFEIIDIRKEKEVVNQWKKFIETHHYDYSTNFFESSLAHNPRRTSESYFQHIEPLTIDEAFSDSNPVPSNFKTLKELWDWFKPLIDAEDRWKMEKVIKKEIY